MEEHEVRFMKLEQSDKEKTDLIAKLEHDIEEIRKQTQVIANLQNKSKKNRKFQERCILITQILLGEEPVVEYQPSFMQGLEFGAFFQKYQIALEVQGAQHRLHHTSWYKDVKKLEDVVNRDRLKRCICQDNGIFILEVWYDEKPEDVVNRDWLKRCICQDNGIFLLDEKPEIVIPERIQKIKGFVNQTFRTFDL
ncbi:8768_t:CDS:1 [Diversispora eburnea]|uniref:8768_t:CDS:1 n=1 Tax=Diversispora eburnea TaxID=1213867 RepID=A0A9N8VMG0_9GLOM|nr:8768_t:CDS:1 [Diversispora eburnea]